MKIFAVLSFLLVIQYSNLAKVIFDNVQYTFNEKYLSNFSAYCFNDSLGYSKFYLQGSLHVDMLRVPSYFTLTSKSNEKSSEYDKNILQGNYDICSVEKGIFGNLLVKLIFENAKKYSNLPFSCPVKKNFYYLKDFYVNPEEHLNLFMLAGHRGSFLLLANTKGKPENSKKFVDLFTIKYMGRLLD